MRSAPPWPLAAAILILLCISSVKAGGCAARVSIQIIPRTNGNLYYRGASLVILLNNLEEAATVTLWRETATGFALHTTIVSNTADSFNEWTVPLTLEQAKYQVRAVTASETATFDMAIRLGVLSRLAIAPKADTGATLSSVWTRGLTYVISFVSSGVSAVNIGAQPVRAVGVGPEGAEGFEEGGEALAIVDDLELTYAATGAVGQALSGQQRYEWEIPALGVETGYYRLQVVSSTDPGIRVELAPTQLLGTIEVTAPTPADAFLKGAPIDLRWLTTGDVWSVVVYVIGPDASPTRLASVSNAQSYTWMAGADIPSGVYSFSVRFEANEEVAADSPEFLVADGRVTCGSVAATATFGSGVRVTWGVAGAVSRLTFRLLNRDPRASFGVAPHELARGLPASPAAASLVMPREGVDEGTYFVEVVSSEDPLVLCRTADFALYSDRNGFSAPAPNADLTRGALYDIAWYGLGPFPELRIELLAVSASGEQLPGSGAALVAARAPNTRRLAWRVPSDAIAGGYRLRIVAGTAANPSVITVVSEPFTVTPALIDRFTLENFVVYRGGQLALDWSSAGQVDTLDLLFRPVDSLERVLFTAASVPAAATSRTGGRLVYTVPPGLPLGECQLEIRNAHDPTVARRDATRLDRGAGDAGGGGGGAWLRGDTAAVSWSVVGNPLALRVELRPAADPVCPPPAPAPARAGATRGAGGARGGPGERDGGGGGGGLLRAPPGLPSGPYLVRVAFAADPATAAASAPVTVRAGLIRGVSPATIPSLHDSAVAVTIAGEGLLRGGRGDLVGLRFGPYACPPAAVTLTPAGALVVPVGPPPACPVGAGLHAVESGARGTARRDAAFLVSPLPAAAGRSSSLSASRPPSTPSTRPAPPRHTPPAPGGPRLQATPPAVGGGALRGSRGAAAGAPRGGAAVTAAARGSVLADLALLPGPAASAADLRALVPRLLAPAAPDPPPPPPPAACPRSSPSSTSRPPSTPGRGGGGGGGGGGGRGAALVAGAVGLALVLRARERRRAGLSDVFSPERPRSATRRRPPPPPTTTAPPPSRTRPPRPPPAPGAGGGGGPGSGAVRAGQRVRRGEGALARESFDDAGAAGVAPARPAPPSSASAARAMALAALAESARERAPPRAPPRPPAPRAPPRRRPPPLPPAPPPPPRAARGPRRPPPPRRCASATPRRRPPRPVGLPEAPAPAPAPQTPAATPETAPGPPRAPPRPGRPPGIPGAGVGGAAAAAGGAAPLGLGFLLGARVPPPEARSRSPLPARLPPIAAPERAAAALRGAAPLAAPAPASASAGSSGRAARRALPRSGSSRRGVVGVEQWRPESRGGAGQKVEEYTPHYEG
eukprot:tig00020930_g16019.t1